MKSLDFDALNDLVKLISKNKTKQLEVIGYGSQGDNLVDQLYDGISKGKFENDDDAAEFLFGSHAKDPKYKKLRYRFLRQLVNAAFFIDSQETMFADYKRAAANCYRDYVAAQILIGHSAYRAAIFLLYQVLEQSQKYELTWLNTEITRNLLGQYGTIIHDSEEHTRIQELFRKFERMRTSETLAYDYYSELVKYYTSRQTPNEEVHQLASKYYTELLGMSHEEDTAFYLYYRYMIGIIMYSSIGNYEELYNLTNTALEKLSGRIGMNKGRIYGIALQKIFCLTQLRIQDKTLVNETFDYCLSLSDEGKYNWFKVLEVKCYYYLHTQKYQEAFELFKLTYKRPEFKSLTGKTSEEFNMLKGYFHLLAILGQIDANALKDLIGEYDLSWQDLMMQFEVVDKDREGLNIPLLHLPILLNIANGDYYNYGRSAEALDKYRQRYLETELNKRSACFLKLLLALGKWHFEKDASERKIQKELELMFQLKPDLNRQAFFVEVIPYEHLWPIIYEHVTKKKT